MCLRDIADIRQRRPGKTVITKWFFNVGQQVSELLKDSAIPDKIGKWKNYASKTWDYYQGNRRERRGVCSRLSSAC
jgi:hypothetical protein